MSVTEFNNQYNQILSQIRTVLPYKCPPVRKLTTCIAGINAIEKLMQVDDPQPPIENWHTAKRIVCYNTLKKTLVAIQKHVSIKSLIPKIKTNIQSINDQIEKLTQFIASNIRLPFKIGPEREEYYTKIKNCVKLRDATRVHYVEKEFFHLLGNHLPLEGIDIKLYEGSTDLQSLISWKSIIKQYIAEDNSNDPEALALLSLIKKAIPITLKSTYIMNFVEQENVEEAEMEYFTDLSRCKKTAFIAHGRTALNQKYELSIGSVIPQIVIINEIAWDIIDAINALKEKEEHLFLFGTSLHAVAVKIQCMRHADNPEERTYDFKVYNTGNCAATYHITDQVKHKAYPLIFKGVSRASLSYKFVSFLIRISKDGTNMHVFYRLLDKYLVTCDKSVKVKDRGPMYDLQRQVGICAYQCVEAVNHSGFSDEAKKKRFKEFTSRTAISKLEKAVQIVAMSQQQPKIVGEKRKRESIADQPPTKRLKSDRSLLQLAQAYQASHMN